MNETFMAFAPCGCARIAVVQSAGFEEQVADLLREANQRNYRVEMAPEGTRLSFKTCGTPTCPFVKVKQVTLFVNEDGATCVH